MKDIFEGTYVTKYPLVGLITDSQAIPPGKNGEDWYAEVAELASKIGPTAGGKQDL